MVDPSCEDDGVLREWSPLSALLCQIPLKAQRGLFTGDLNLTCIAALPDYLVIGTNHGLVYWYNRLTNELQRLRCENTACAITCVAVTSTVDYMIAAGASNGIVSVFVVPKTSPDNIPDVLKTNSKKQVELFTVRDLHSASVSAVEWSLNGMKLFSGDKKGTVVLTEIDFYMHLSKSAEILNEKYEVVQLSYNSNNQLLLVSTVYRTILCHRGASNESWKVSQVGNKERKMLGKMGATFYNNADNPRSPVAYCSRPGLRVWVASKVGVVEKTLIFKESVQGQLPFIPLLNPTKSQRRQPQGEPQLGPLLMFKGNFLVTYTPDSVLILDPDTISVVAALYDIQKISALCVSKSEIFILEGERHLMRIGFTPEDLPRVFDESASSQSGILTNPFIELTSKLRDTSISSVIPINKLSPIFSPSKSAASSDGEQISECMEAQELPPVVSLDSFHPVGSEGMPELQVHTDSFLQRLPGNETFTKAQTSSVIAQGRESIHSELLDQISQQQFEEIVFQPKRKIKKNKNKRGSATAGTESGSDTTSVVSTTSENDEAWCSERVDSGSEWCGVGVNTSRRSSVDVQSKTENHVLKPGSSLTGENSTCRKKVKDKDLVESSGNFLMQPLELNFSRQEPKLENYMACCSFSVDHHNEEEIKETLLAKERILAKKYNLEAELGISLEEKNSSDLDMPGAGCIAGAELVKGSEECSPEGVNELDSQRSTSASDECMHDSILSYGLPSGRSQFISGHSSLDLEPSDAKENIISTVCKEAMEASDWLQFSTPKPINSVTVCSHYLMAIDTQDTVHYCGLGGLGLKWQKADCKATHLSLSPNANCVWRLHDNVAYALKNPAASGPHGDLWLEAATNVRSLAVGEGVAWFVSQDGDVFCQKGLNRATPLAESVKVDKPCEWPATKIVCFSQIVWILTATGEVYVRLGISSAKPEGADWKRVNIPIPGSVVDISLGSQRSGWIIDNTNKIMFSVDHMEHEPHWWQVLISDFVFQQTSPLQRLRTKITKNLRPALPGRHSPHPSVACGPDSVWILQPSSNTLHANKTKITGHSWTRLKLHGSPVGTKWQTVSAEGIFENGGQLWLLSANGDLFCCQQYNNRKLQEIPLPTSDGAVCLAASSQALWLLTSSGDIYIRQGLSNSCLEGNNWTQLSLMQIEDIHLSHVSCGLDVVWACDTAGNMHMTVSSPHAMATATFSPVWIRVPDSKEQKKIFFIKVFAGPQTYMVWGLDNQGKIYVREAIFPDFPLGADWVPVTGITAVDLSVSAIAVWALSVDGDVYRRQGITQNNYIGDYWKKVPGSVEALTASICDRLWGIDKNGSLLRHAQMTVNLNPGLRTPTVLQPEVVLPGDEGDWEVL